MRYDSTEDTLKHIKRVGDLLTMAARELFNRAKVHDMSKLSSPEKEGFDKFTPKLKGSTYGSEEYNKFLVGLGDVLKHHYEYNSHHPEHYSDLIDGFDLFDLLEMFCDWVAASERHEDGNIYKSIKINQKRFKMSGQVCKIFKNTVKRYIEK